MRRHTLVMLAILILAPMLATAQQRAAFVMEHTYWIKPGKSSQFIALFRKNTLPALQAEQADGRILWIRMARPRASAGNEQWDFRVTVGWRDAETAWQDKESSRPRNLDSREGQRLTIEETLSEELVLERTDVPVQETSVD